MGSNKPLIGQKWSKIGLYDVVMLISRYFEMIPALESRLFLAIS